MGKIQILAGATSVSVNVFIRDSSSTTGAGLTGLASNTASLTAYYALPRAAAVAIALATLAAVTSAFSSGGFKEIDATNMPGWYRLDIPNAALASGRFVDIHLQGAANMAPTPVEIELTATNNQVAGNGLLTATLTQRDVSALSTSTVEDALSAARAQGAGAWTIVGTTLTLKNPDGTTFRALTLDSATAPTSRT